MRARLMHPPPGHGHHDRTCAHWQTMHIPREIRLIAGFVLAALALRGLVVFLDAIAERVEQKSLYR